MAIYTNLPVYEDCYQLFLKFIQLSIKMQRDYRYSLAEDVKRKLMSVILNIYKANYSKDNLGVENVIEAKDCMVEVQVILRLLNEIRQIPDKHYTILMEMTVGISRQLEFWEKSKRSKKIKGN